MNYKKDYGLKDMRPRSIEKLISHLSKTENLKELKNYMSDKYGYGHAKREQYKKGIELAESDSLISRDHHNADTYIC